MRNNLKQLLASYGEQVDSQLEQILPVANGPAEALFAAMRYSVFNGGKRLRPALCFAAAEAVAASDDNTARVAAALEMIHAYSLIHDDLPAMDNDDLRRGKPTCHIQFDEATAILAGDGLQSLAFQQLTELRNISAELVVKLLSMLATYSGCSGMVTGQAIDLAATGQSLNLEQLKTMHRHKTGALIEAVGINGRHNNSQGQRAAVSCVKEICRRYWAGLSDSGRYYRCRELDRAAGQTTGIRCTKSKIHLYLYYGAGRSTHRGSQPVSAEHGQPGSVWRARRLAATASQFYC